MTFTVRTRGAPTLISQQYACPAHGLFVLVETCNVDETPRACPDCGASSEYRIAAPTIGVKYASAVNRGRSDERPPGMLDTRPLAEGMSMTEWRAKQDKISDELRRKKIKAMVS